VQATPNALLLIVILAYAVALAVAAISLRSYLRSLPTGGPSGAQSDHWLAASLPFLAVALLGIAATELNTLALGLLSGPRDAGLYQPIARIAPLMLIAKEAIDMPLAPRIAGLWEADDREQLRRLIHRCALASFLATAVVVAAIILASPYIFAAFGSEFEPYSHYLYWIAAAHMANAVFGPSSLLLAMAGDMKRRMRAQAATLAVQAVLTTALVPVFGVAGAVVALSIQIIFWAALNWILARRSTQIDTSTFSAIRAWLKTGQ
jgi:O-antigen/teichoic acid export membrane protein